MTRDALMPKPALIRIPILRVNSSRRIGSKQWTNNSAIRERFKGTARIHQEVFDKEVLKSVGLR